MTYVDCVRRYEGENRVSVYASEFEQRTDDVSGVEYTVYKLNVRRGDDRHVLHKRWSKCDKLQKDIAREHKVGMRLGLSLYSQSCVCLFSCAVAAACDRIPSEKMAANERRRPVGETALPA